MGESPAWRSSKICQKFKNQFDIEQAFFLICRLRVVLIQWYKKSFIMRTRLILDLNQGLPDFYLEVFLGIIHKC